MSKTFNTFEKAAIRNAAAAIANINGKKDTLDKKIAQLEKAKEALDEEAAPYYQQVDTITGGYKPQDLCERNSVGKMVFKYPETIIPVSTESEAVRGDYTEEVRESTTSSEGLGNSEAPRVPMAENNGDINGASYPMTPSESYSPEEMEAMREAEQESLNDANDEGTLPPDAVEESTPVTPEHDPIDDIF